jgi:hypothetical protein
MRFTLGGIAVSLYLTLLACSPHGQQLDDLVPAAAETALGAEQDGAELYVLASGHYSRYIYRGAYSESFWVDLSVRNDARQKEVAVIWTMDDWATQNVSSASFEGQLPGGRERWGVDIKDFTTRWGSGPLEVEYAAYVRMNGQTHWSLYRNHYIYNGVSPDAPLRLLQSRVELDDSGAPRLLGTVRALEVRAERRAFVRFTTDEWDSYTDVEAEWDGRDFSFESALPYDPETTQEVAFAVRLETQGETVWLANGGANYRHRLSPTLTEVRFQDDGERPASGIRVLSASAHSDLPIRNAWIRIDEGPRVALPDAPPAGTLGVGGLSSGGSISYAFPVASLSTEQHSLTLEVAAGPFVRRSTALTFNVSNDLEALAHWDVSAAETAWDLKALPDGRLLLMREQQLETYAVFGADAPERVISLSPGPRLEDVDVDEASRILVLRQGQITRLLPDGDVDVGFAVGGTLTLNGTYGARPLCYAANLEFAHGFLYVLDSCNSRALQFDADGAYVAELDLAVPGISTNVTRTFDDGRHVWVGRDLFDGSLRHDLVAITDGATFGLGAVKPLDLAVANLDAFALQNGEIWATSGWDDLHVLSADTGSAAARWTGGRWALPGAIHIGRSVVPLSDGSVAVLSVDTGKVERFARRR